MVTIKTYNNAGEAGAAQSRLNSAGISVLLADEFSFSVGYPVGGLRLQVSPADADTAKRILDEHEGFAPLPDDFVPPDLPPALGTQPGQPRERGNLFAFAAGGSCTVLGFGLLALLALIFRGQAHATFGGIAALFLLGGIGGIVVRFIYCQGMRNASRPPDGL